MAKGASQSTPADAPRYVARRSGFQYAGKDIDRGQVVTLAGQRNDESLVRLGYFILLERRVELHTCSFCGEEFIGISERTAHGDARHRHRDLTPDEEDDIEERREKREQELAPLYLDKTKASLEAA